MLPSDLKWSTYHPGMGTRITDSNGGNYQPSLLIKFADSRYIEKR
jgi:hypothetical protein